ncbi:hypothetical protein NEHOM01_0855 [Nematocida homosporus]|uniref:uncharacterized protein n=1 Tax=Nematocida homosporus TaxID=1912981 RepID=UPI00221EB4D3|nr:uncharacterized protein NEHOM01_0855 [Nematocida homosporus]KAI5185496.1 hypothetical protein NEHOM01_0855 [Nematocida homosporus]
MTLGLIYILCRRSQTYNPNIQCQTVVEVVECAFPTTVSSSSPQCKTNEDSIDESCPNTNPLPTPDEQEEEGLCSEEIHSNVSNDSKTRILPPKFSLLSYRCLGCSKALSNKITTKSDPSSAMTEIAKNLKTLWDAPQQTAMKNQDFYEQAESLIGTYVETTPILEQSIFENIELKDNTGVSPNTNSTHNTNLNGSKLHQRIECLWNADPCELEDGWGSLSRTSEQKQDPPLSRDELLVLEAVTLCRLANEYGKSIKDEMSFLDQTLQCIITESPSTYSPDKTILPLSQFLNKHLSIFETQSASIFLTYKVLIQKLLEASQGTRILSDRFSFNPDPNASQPHPIDPTPIRFTATPIQQPYDKPCDACFNNPGFTYPVHKDPKTFIEDFLMRLGASTIRNTPTPDNSIVLSGADALGHQLTCAIKWPATAIPSTPEEWAVILAALCCVQIKTTTLTATPINAPAKSLSDQFKIRKNSVIAKALDKLGVNLLFLSNSDITLHLIHNFARLFYLKIEQAMVEGVLLKDTAASLKNIVAKGIMQTVENSIQLKRLRNNRALSRVYGLFYTNNGVCTNRSMDYLCSLKQHEIERVVKRAYQTKDVFLSLTQAERPTAKDDVRALKLFLLFDYYPDLVQSIRKLKQTMRSSSTESGLDAQTKEGFSSSCMRSLSSSSLNSSVSSLNGLGNARSRPPVTYYGPLHRSQSLKQSLKQTQEQAMHLYKIEISDLTRIIRRYLDDNAHFFNIMVWQELSLFMDEQPCLGWLIDGPNAYSKILAAQSDTEACAIMK